MNAPAGSNPTAHSWLEHDGALLRVRMSRPNANIVDAAMVAALHDAFERNQTAVGLKAALLDAEGPNFSFGASVEEHLADRCAGMLTSLHRLVLTMIDFPVPILVAVQGQCLGGGLELAMSGSQLFASPNAKLGQPEIRLGVFAPAASVMLPERVRLAVAEDMLLSGRSLDAAEAQLHGLVNAVGDDPTALALDWFVRRLAPHSGTSLAFALTAVRAPLRARVRHRLAEVERLYLDGLMETHDANEGLAAFLEKRSARWGHGASSTK